MTRRLELLFFYKCVKEFKLSWKRKKMIRGIDFPKNFNQNIELFWWLDFFCWKKKKKKTWLTELNPCFPTWLIEIEPFFSTWLWHIFDSKIWTCFWVWVKELNSVHDKNWTFFRMTQRFCWIELKESNFFFFEDDPKNRTFFFFKICSKNCFSEDSQNWTCFSALPQEWNIWEFDSKNWTLFDSKNWTSLEI